MAADTMKNTKHPLFLCLGLLIYLALVSCSTPTHISATKPTAVVDERHIEEIMATGRPLAAVRYLDKRSVNAQPAEQAELKLRSIEILFDQGYPELASSRLHTLEGNLGKPSLMNRYKILQAQSFLLQSQPAEALKILPAISGNMSTSTQVRLLKTKALAQGRSNLTTKALLSRQSLASLLTTDSARFSNYDQIWRLLNKQSTAELLKTKSTIQHPDLDGWIKFALAIKAAQKERSSLTEEFQNWSAFHPRHPLVSSYGQQLIEKIASTGVKPKFITLLLPFSGGLASSSAAIRDGFFAAYFDDANNPERPTLLIKDSGEDPTVIWQHYNAAVEQGSELVVGPLRKEAVSQLAFATQLPVPTIALNYAQEQQAQLPDNLTQFGLLPEDEARQMAEYAIQKQLSHAVIFAADSSWSNRIADAFMTHYSALGGTNLKLGRFTPGSSDFSTAIRSTLNITESLNRNRLLKNTLGTKLEFIPTRRQDADLIFLVASPEEARQIKPQLKFHYAGDIPVFTTSHAFTGEIDLNADHDLNGLIYVDIPWILNQQTSGIPQQVKSIWPQSQQYARLYALGADAYRLLPSIGTLKTDTESFIDGNTGRLSMDTSGRIHRKLQLAQFIKGKPVSLQFDATPTIPQSE